MPFRHCLSKLNTPPSRSPVSAMGMLLACLPLALLHGCSGNVEGNTTLSPTVSVAPTATPVPSGVMETTPGATTSAEGAPVVPVPPGDRKSVV